MGWDQVRPEGFTLLEFSLFRIWSRECPPTHFKGGQINSHLCVSAAK